MLYVVTAGEYSAYAICGIFSSKEKAQAAIEWSGALNVMIEEWPLDAVDVSDNRSYWTVDIVIETGDIISFSNRGRHLSCNFDLVETVDYIHFNPQTLKVYLWAETEEIAKKIATEKRQEYLAQKALSNSVA